MSLSSNSTRSNVTNLKVRKNSKDFFMVTHKPRSHTVDEDGDMEPLFAEGISEMSSENSLIHKETSQENSPRTEAKILEDSPPRTDHSEPDGSACTEPKEPENSGEMDPAMPDDPPGKEEEQPKNSSETEPQSVKVSFDIDPERQEGHPGTHATDLEESRLDEAEVRNDSPRVDPQNSESNALTETDKLEAFSEIDLSNPDDSPDMEDTKNAEQESPRLESETLENIPTMEPSTGEPESTEMTPRTKPKVAPDSTPEPESADTSPKIGAKRPQEDDDEDEDKGFIARMAEKAIRFSTAIEPGEIKEVHTDSEAQPNDSTAQETISYEKTFQWKITNFTKHIERSLSHPNESILLSPEFFIEDSKTKVNVKLYPTGNIEDEGIYLSIYFRFTPTDKSIVVKKREVTFSVIDVESEMSNSESISYHMSMECVEKAISAIVGSGSHKCFSIRNLQEKGLFNNDTIYISVAIEEEIEMMK